MIQMHQSKDWSSSCRSRDNDPQDMTGAFAWHSIGEEAKGQELYHGTSRAQNLAPMERQIVGWVGQELGSQSDVVNRW